MRRHPWLTAAIVFFLLCVILFFCMEWRAEKRWQRYAAEARARGVKLYLTEFARPEIPAGQNFAALPMLKKTAAGGNDSTPFKLPDRPRPAQATNSPGFGNAHKGQKIDWVEWQAYFQAVGFLTEKTEDAPRDVLRALDHYAPQFQEWGEWRTTRPKCQLPTDATGRKVIPGVMHYAVWIFALRMRAHLAVGDSASAYGDFQDGLQAYRVLRDATGLVSGVLRVGMLHILLQGVGDGLQSHQWADPELKKIEADLAAIRLQEVYVEALAAERIGLNAEIERMMNASFRERARVRDYVIGSLSSRPAVVFQLLPRSVFRANELRLNRYIDELTAGTGPTFDPDHPTPSSPANITNAYERDYYFLCQVVENAYSVVEEQAIRLQIVMDQARLACALERFRRARGLYPESLTELAPEFLAKLPADIYARAPYRYRRVGKASFQLYSVGKNRRDDGGSVDPALSTWDQADAIWLYAPPAAP